MIDQPALAQAIAEVASRWKDPDYSLRENAVSDTLLLENRFTEEALAFAINQQMALLDAEALLQWIGGRTVRSPKTVGVLNAGNVPLAGLQDLLAVILTGANYRGVLSSKSSRLLPAFVNELIDLYPALDIDFVGYGALLDRVDAVIASGNDETIALLRKECREHGLSDRQCLLRGHRYGVAILTGTESLADRENLAEDVLLHEGSGCRNAAIIWAPESLSPDPYLDAFASFRGVFPAHRKTPGSLKMKQAFLDAIGASHAYGEGLEFLVSKGKPEQQEPGHVRWSSYRTVEEVIGWIKEHEHEIQLVVTGNPDKNRFDITPPVLSFGEAQRPALNWCAGGIDTIAFLEAL